MDRSSRELELCFELFKTHRREINEFEFLDTHCLVVTKPLVHHCNQPVTTISRCTRCCG